AGCPPVVVEVLVVEGDVTGVVGVVKEVWGRVLVVEAIRHWEYPKHSFSDSLVLRLWEIQKGQEYQKRSSQGQENRLGTNVDNGQKFLRKKNDDVLESASVNGPWCREVTGQLKSQLEFPAGGCGENEVVSKDQRRDHGDTWEVMRWGEKRLSEHWDLYPSPCLMRKAAGPEPRLHLKVLPPESRTA
ncbi:5730_t:CDS:2, partial [Acaulospora colombiana]